MTDDDTQHVTFYLMSLTPLDRIMTCEYDHSLNRALFC
jgi:hypothetical protein